MYWFFGHVPKRLDKKDTVNFKLFDVTASLANYRIHILPNISRSKGNQTLKFGQLVECNMWNIFLEKLYTKYDGEASPNLFSEKLNLSLDLWINSLRFYIVCFYCISSWGLLKHIKTKLQTTFFYLILSIFFFFLKKEV